MPLANHDRRAAGCSGGSRSVLGTLVLVVFLSLVLLGGAEPAALAAVDAQPIVVRVKPDAGSGVGGTRVHILGSNFTGASAVRFGGTPAVSFAVESARKITATAPAGTGTVDITVTTPEGTSATGASDRFSYLPAVTSVEPRVGPVGGGYEVMINGVALGEATGVDFGATAAASFKVDSPTSITAVAPSEAAGDVGVRVTTAQGTSRVKGLEDHFTFTPTVTSVSPEEGPTAGGERVTVTGTGFVSGATTFAFGRAWMPGQCDSSTECTVVTPPRNEAAPDRAEAFTVLLQVAVHHVTSPRSYSGWYTYALRPLLAIRVPDHGPLVSPGTGLELRYFFYVGSFSCDEHASGEVLTNDEPVDLIGVDNLAGSCGLLGRSFALSLNAAGPNEEPTASIDQPLSVVLAGGLEGKSACYYEAEGMSGPLLDVTQMVEEISDLTTVFTLVPEESEEEACLMFPGKTLNGELFVLGHLVELGPPFETEVVGR